MPTVLRRATVLSALLIAVGVLIGFVLKQAEPNTSHLVASWKTTPGGIGIPGLTKTYEAALTNRGILPIRISACDYVTDALTHARAVAYWVERWDRRKAEWRYFWGIPSEEFCKPHGLDITTDSRVRSVWLWPRQSLSTDFVAIQATDGLELNDRLRFAIRSSLTRPDLVVYTPPFTIDERPTRPDAANAERR